MSVQNRSFFALKCQHGYWAEIPPVPGISLCGGMPFTLGASFLYPHKGDDNILIQQEGVFSFGVNNGSVYFEAKNLGSFRTDPGMEPKLLEDEWCRADVVYDGAAVRVYVQGLLALEAGAAGAEHIDQETRWRLGAMDGYLQEAVLYSGALTAEEVLHLQFTHEVPAEQTELWADFDAFSPTDRGRHALPLQLKGGCTAVNLVYSFAPGRNGFALPYGSGQVNPGALASGGLTLLAAVFPKELSAEDRQAAANAPPSDSDTVIFTNGAHGGKQTVALGLTGDTGKPFLTLGETRFPFSTALNNYSWYQIAAVVKGTDVSLYVDGEPAGTGTLAQPFARTEAPALMIGNQDENGQMARGFRGCIDMVAVFDAALPAPKLKVYAGVPPYRFEEHLAALWLFSDQYPMEVVSGAGLTYSGGMMGSAPQENTVLDREPPALAFYMPDSPTGMDEMETWETRVAAEAVLQGIESLTGMEPSSGFSDPGNDQLNGSMAVMVAQYVSSDPRVSGLASSGKISGEDMGELLGAIMFGAFAGAVCYGFYMSAQNGGLRRIMWVRRFLRFFRMSWRASNWPVIGGVLAGGAAAAAKRVEEKPAPDPGTCTSGDYAVTFKSLSFYHEESLKAGALFGVPDFGAAPVLPEWSKTENRVNSAPVLYHRDIPSDQTPSVILSFYCDKKCKDPLTLSFQAFCMEGSGLDSVLGAPSSGSVTITATGDYSVTLPLPEHKLKTAGLGAFKIRWQWQVSSPGAGEKLVGKTDHTIHVLAAKPLSPWTTERDSKYPPVYPAISLCHLIAGENSSEKDPDRRFAGQFVSWSHGGGKLEALPWAGGSKYAAWGMDEQRVLAFDIKGCVTALQNGKAQVGALDCASLHYAFTRLEGLEKLRLFRLGSMREGASLYLRPARRTGAAEDDEFVFLDNYHVCGIPHEKAPPDIWDGFLTLRSSEGKPAAISGMAFSAPNQNMDMISGPDNGQYRTLLCQPGSTCEVTLSVSWLWLERLPPQTVKPGEPGESVLESGPGRPKFDSYITQAIPLPPYLVRCHSISYKSIENAVVQMVNDLYNEKYSPEQFEQIMSAIWLAVTRNSTGEFEDKFQQVAWEKIQLLSDPGNYEDFEQAAKEANLLLSALNNSKNNLRPGMSDWNSSLQDSFDPAEWVHITVPFRPFMSGVSRIDAAYDNPMAAEDLPDDTFLNAPLQFSGFYLFNSDDVERIKALRPYYYNVFTKQPPLRPLIRLSAVPLLIPAQFAGGVSDTRRLILESSSNKWNLRDYPCISNERCSPLLRYYLDDTAGPQWLPF